MKSNKVLLGLFVGLMALAGGALNAQNATKDAETPRLYEIGPDNIGGAVSSLVADRQDANNTTLYAGAIGGGLFVRSSNTTILNNLYQALGLNLALASDTTIWHHVPYVVDGKELALPISCMIQGAEEAQDNNIYIGTGSDEFSLGTTYYSAMSRQCVGLFRFNPNATDASSMFTEMPTTADFLAVMAINDIDLIYRNGVTYLFAATDKGLYRWKIEGATITPEKICGGDVRDLQIIRTRKTGYFTVGNQVWKIADLTRDNINPVDISATNIAFGGGATNVLLAVAPSNPDYLYAAVLSNGRLSALYLTTNEQTWHLLTTSSVNPFTGNAGNYCGTLTVDPTNHKRIAIGGSTVWVGEGYNENSYYLWTQSSANEDNLNGGDYMSHVFNNASFVHSNIHQILPVYDPRIQAYRFYIATDGGVFMTNRNFGGYANISRGLNCLQITGLSVAADGSILSGAYGNACPFIETLNDLSFSSEASRESYRNSNISWYDDGSLILNHSANILWHGNGSATAASAFQQVKPNARRNIIVSSTNVSMGRSYADYLDFTNTTTWTVDSSFTSNRNKGNDYVQTDFYLWETDKDSIFNSTATFTIDTLGSILRGDSTIYLNDARNGARRGSRFIIQPHDKITFYSRGHADYPFEYEFQDTMTANHKITVKNPVQSRIVTVGKKEKDNLSTVVWYNWQPTDFTRVWDRNEISSDPDKCMIWSPIMIVTRSSSADFADLYLRNAVISNDGRFVYCSAVDQRAGRSMLFRIGGFENIDFTKRNDLISSDMDYTNGDRVLYIDTLKVNDSKWFNRAISSIAVDPREGYDRLVLTFEGYTEEYDNIAIVNNASDSNYSIQGLTINVDNNSYKNIPSYCAIVEDSTGNIYVGTAEGLFYKTTSWHADSRLANIPVTAMCQQTKSYPIRRNLTHTGITANNYAFARTKWPRAIYFGTYGRGIFMDMTYVTDFSNDIVEASDLVDIPTVASTGTCSLSLYPNPVTDVAHLTLSAETAGNAQLRVYDLNGRMVMNRNLGHVAEGEHSFSVSTDGMPKGMYLINVSVSGHTAAAKMIVR